MNLAIAGHLRKLGKGRLECDQVPILFPGEIPEAKNLRP